MNKDELKEQLQQDLLAYLDGQPEEVLTEVCNIVVRNVNQLGVTPDEVLESAKAGVIKDIQEILGHMNDQTGEDCISTAELEADSSPCLAADGDYSRLAETFYKDGADVVSYVGSTETKSEFIKYEELTYDVLVQIKELVAGWS
jgi:hypothetical protein